MSRPLQKPAFGKKIQSERYFSLSEDGSCVVCKTITTIVLPREVFEEALRLRKIHHCFQESSTPADREGE